MNTCWAPPGPLGQAAACQRTGAPASRAWASGDELAAVCPAGLLIERGHVRVAVDGGPGAEPDGPLAARLVTDQRAESSPRSAAGRGARARPPRPAAAETGSTPHPIVHTSHPTCGYLIEASGPAWSGRLRASRTHVEQFMTLCVPTWPISKAARPRGIHLAAIAGTIDVLQRCFAGIETRDDVLWLNPYWLHSLGALEFPSSTGAMRLLHRHRPRRALHDAPGTCCGCGLAAPDRSTPRQTLGFPLGQAAADPATPPLA